jgi:hypothetical protein
VLTTQQRSDFAEHGVVRLDGAFSDADAARMRGVVWRELERRYGIFEHDRATWTMATPSRMSTSKRAAAFAPIGGRALQDAVDELLGAGAWQPPAHWGQLMITFPERDATWTLPSRLWHIDWSYTNAPEPLFGVKVFAFFGDVPPRGGGTLVVTGSHRVVEQFVAATPPEERDDYRACRLRFMRHDPWFGALGRSDDPDPYRTARFMDDDHDIDGVRVRVVELTGRAGDIVVTHPWVLHHAAPNTGSYPRLMRGRNIDLRRDDP